MRQVPWRGWQGDGDWANGDNKRLLEKLQRSTYHLGVVSCDPVLSSHMGQKMDACTRYQGGLWVSCGQTRYDWFAAWCDGKTSQSD